MDLKALEKDFIQTPEKWPIKGTLYMKNSSNLVKGLPDTGMMKAGDTLTIYEDDLYTVKAKFETIDKLLEAGWMVD